MGYKCYNESGPVPFPFTPFVGTAASAQITPYSPPYPLPRLFALRAAGNTPNSKSQLLAPASITDPLFASTDADGVGLDQTWFWERYLLPKARRRRRTADDQPSSRSSQRGDGRAQAGHVAREAVVAGERDDLAARAPRAASRTGRSRPGRSARGPRRPRARRAASSPAGRAGGAGTPGRARRARRSRRPSGTPRARPKSGRPRAAAGRASGPAASCAATLVQAASSCAAGAGERAAGDAIGLLDERHADVRRERGLHRRDEIARADAAAGAVTEQQRRARRVGGVQVRARRAVRGVELARRQSSRRASLSAASPVRCSGPRRLPAVRLDPLGHLEVALELLGQLLRERARADAQRRLVVELERAVVEVGRADRGPAAVDASASSRAASSAGTRRSRRPHSSSSS